MQEALLYEKLEKNRVRCNLCAHRCVIADGKKGVCQVRENKGGALFSLVYGRAISQGVDPVEKKPLYHFYPGSLVYSFATPGCNFRCQWCQNWQISQMPREQDLISGQEVSPDQIINNAMDSGTCSVAYTYTEPTVFFEYAYQTAMLAHLAGLANIFVTNGYMSPEMLEMFHPYLDAVNVDLKSFRKETYYRFIGAGLNPVLDNLKFMKQLGIWVEVTTLVIPGLNDDSAELRDIARFIALELGSDTPWHLSRFFPGYKMSDHPPTPIKTLQLAQQIGFEEGLYYVYVGNTPDDKHRNTFCPECGHMLIRRQGYWIVENEIHKGRCLACGASISGFWTMEKK
jgi:pyruvate formate lyase activating enzyme